MDDAAIVKLVQQTIENKGSNGSVLAGFVALAGLYIIKTLWIENQRRLKDPSGEVHREETRKKIAHIEDRQGSIMESIEDMRTTLKYIGRELERLKQKD